MAGPNALWRLEATLFSDTPRLAVIRAGGCMVASFTVERVGCASVLVRPPSVGPLRVVIESTEVRRPARDIPDCTGFTVRSLRLYRAGDVGAPARPRGDEILDDPSLHPTAIGERDLFTRFESLGGNCEFGIAQRCFGAEPNDLFRFANIPLGSVLDAIDHRFSGIDVQDRMLISPDLQPDGQEYYYIYQYDYNIPFATGINVADMEIEHARKLLLNRFKLLSRTFLEDLEDGGRIFVAARQHPYSWCEIDALTRRVRSFGPATILLVEQAAPGHPAESVERVAPGVLRAYLAAFADGTRIVDTINPAQWLTICRKAYRIWWYERAGLPSPAMLPAEFDPFAYLDANPDVGWAGMDPGLHYMSYGVYEDRPLRPPLRQPA